MKRSLPLLLLFLPALLRGQDTPNALLWNISGNGLDRPSHLYGTVHSTDERAYTFSQAVETTMDGVATVAGELDLDATRKAIVAMLSSMTLPGGKRLEDLYSKKDWKIVDAALKERHGSMATMFMRSKPFYIMADMTEGAMKKDRPKMLDDHLLGEAKEKDKRVIGLETVREQLAAIDALPLKEQAAMLLEHIKRGGDAKDMEDMMNAYAAQDLGGLMALAQRHPMPRVLEQALFADRNLRMAHRMDSVMRVDGSALFLVGAAHLPGKGGVVELLRERGYKVEPARVEAGENRPYFPPARLLPGGIHFVDDKFRFGVDLPTAPNVDTDNNGIERRVASIHGKSSLGVIVVVLVKNPLGTMPIDDIMSKEVEQQWITVQGHEGRRVMAEVDGRHWGVQFVNRDGDYFFVRVGSTDDHDGTLRTAVLDSFRFTDLPDE